MGVASEMQKGGGAKPVAFREMGDYVEGRVVNIRTKQLTSFGSQAPETWPDGEPKMTPIYTVQTDLNEADDDDGQRDVYCRSGVYTAVANALRETFPSDVEDRVIIGSHLRVQFVRKVPSNRGNDRKIYEARFTPKDPGAASSMMGGGQTAKPASHDDDIPF